MYFTTVALFLIASLYIFFGWRAMISEKAHVFPMGNDWRKESGIFGLTGSGLMANAASILMNQPNIYVFGIHPTGVDTIGCAYTMCAISVLTFGMCGLTWFLKTKFAFWIGNRRWPTQEEMAEER